MNTESFTAVRLHDKRIVSADAYNDMCGVLDSLVIAINTIELTRTERKAIERAYEKLYQFRHFRDQKIKDSWPSI